MKAASVVILTHCFMLCCQTIQGKIAYKKRNFHETTTSVLNNDNTTVLVNKTLCDEDKVFHCSAEVCIRLDRRCNGYSYECAENTDELNCDSCSGDSFYCRNDKRCIESYWRCDGYKDCVSGEDEENCECEFFCKADNKCIPKSYVCNGVSSCSDGQDEANCPCEFRCGLTNDSNCVSKESVCDGYPHCPNGEDEFGCACQGFRCADNGCVANDKRCNGWHDCADASDEKNCDFCIGSDSFYCSIDRKCLPEIFHCDGDFNDCPEGKQDEITCN